MTVDTSGPLARKLLLGLRLKSSSSSFLRVENGKHLAPSKDMEDFPSFFPSFFESIPSSRSDLESSCVDIDPLSLFFSICACVCVLVEDISTLLDGGRR